MLKSFINYTSKPLNYLLFIRKFSSKVSINWILKDGKVKQTNSHVGSRLLDIAHSNNIDLEGACAGVCACSTCHVILDENVYNDLPEPTEAEDDMLDQAYGLTHTSRLGCQIIVEKKHEGMNVKLPVATRNFYVDGHVPKPH